MILFLTSFKYSFLYNYPCVFTFDGIFLTKMHAYLHSHEPAGGLHAQKSHFPLGTGYPGHMARTQVSLYCETHSRPPPVSK